MHVKSKGGRSQQQRKKPTKSAKKADGKPKAQAKKPVIDTEKKESKKAAQGKGGKGKDTTVKKSDKSDDSFNFDDGDKAPSVLSLADRLAQRKKASNSSSSGGSGTESASSLSSKAKRQSTLDIFTSTKKAAEKKATKADSDDDFIMEFSDEEVEEVPAVKRTARSAVTTKKVNVALP